MGDALENCVIEVFAELHRALGIAGGAESSLLAGESHKEGVLAGIAVHPRRTVGEKSAVEVLIESCQHLVAKHAVGCLEALFPHPW